MEEEDDISVTTPVSYRDDDDSSIGQHVKIDAAGGGEGKGVDAATPSSSASGHPPCPPPPHSGGLLSSRSLTLAAGYNDGRHPAAEDDGVIEASKMVTEEIQMLRDELRKGKEAVVRQLQQQKQMKKGESAWRQRREAGGYDAASSMATSELPSPIAPKSRRHSQPLYGAATAPPSSPSSSSYEPYTKPENYLAPEGADMDVKFAAALNEESIGGAPPPPPMSSGALSFGAGENLLGRSAVDYQQILKARQAIKSSAYARGRGESRAAGDSLEYEQVLKAASYVVERDQRGARSAEAKHKSKSTSLDVAKLVKPNEVALKKLRAEIAQLRADLAEGSKLNSEMEGVVRKLEREKSSLIDKVTFYRTKIQHSNERVGQLKAIVSNLKGEQGEKKDLTRELETLYSRLESGERDRLKLKSENDQLRRDVLAGEAERKKLGAKFSVAEEALRSANARADSLQEELVMMAKGYNMDLEGVGRKMEDVERENVYLKGKVFKKKELLQKQKVRDGAAKR